MEDTASTEGGEVQQAACKTADNLQPFYIYRDVPGSNKIDIQNKQSGFMIGQERISDNQPMRQYSLGKPDGTGTYLLEKA
ncbi:hypothetical protein GCM10010324_58230 [Streptomyces hiroshimensis]|uniref:Uncharacterized protein n=1 Tax=Streptomyces hiroshimensis TaxID=66424 RepID=A0ABQ2Z3E9_9ACTN|nr:hypothetical protein GCM10010324_58230 [Streptomyces hiroshimensis]